MQNQLSDKPALSRCLWRQKKSSNPPAHMKIAKEPEVSTHAALCGKSSRFMNTTTRCSESAVLGGARQKRFGVRTWHKQQEARESDKAVPQIATLF